MLEKKKICIISSYTYIKKNINYGALFQYYALEKYLKRNGYSPFWLRYIVQEKIDLLRNMKTLVKNVWHIKHSTQIFLTHNAFIKFVREELQVSDRCYLGIESLQKNFPEADVYITGSDQVWGGCESANYLTFVPDNKIKISYAASFGKNNISAQQKQKIAPWLKRMDKISVREKSGVSICRSMGLSATQVVDPTFLINSDEYPAVLPNEKNYCFSYFLNVDRNHAEKLSKACKSSIGNLKFLCTAGVSNMDWVLSTEELVFLSPEEWIGMYKNAKVIFTNTFHGTVFALLFHKSFVVFKQVGSSAKQNERISSLLEAFSLEKRICEHYDSIQKILEEPIDWQKFECTKKILVKKAALYLKEAMDKGGNI